jgi:chromate transport protein ChrA
MRRVRLTSLIREFTWTGLVSLGGRSAYVDDVVASRRGWVTSEEFVHDLTLSQILPGSITR